MCIFLCLSTNVYLVLWLKNTWIFFLKGEFLKKFVIVPLLFLTKNSSSLLLFFYRWLLCINYILMYIMKRYNSTRGFKKNCIKTITTIACPNFKNKLRKRPWAFRGQAIQIRVILTFSLVKWVDLWCKFAITTVAQNSSLIWARQFLKLAIECYLARALEISRTVVFHGETRRECEYLPVQDLWGAVSCMEQSLLSVM